MPNDSLDPNQNWSHPLRKAFEEGCSRFDVEIDYASIDPEMPKESAEGSQGLAMQLWRRVDIDAKLIVKSGFSGADPSLFKIAAAATLSVLKNVPIPAIPEALIDEKDLHDVYRYKHALAAHLCIFQFLCMFHRSNVGTTLLEVENPVVLSQHQLLDAVAALSAQARSIREDDLGPRALASTMNLLALLYESLVYSANPDIRSNHSIEFSRPTDG